MWPSRALSGEHLVRHDFRVHDPLGQLRIAQRDHDTGRVRRQLERNRRRILQRAGKAAEHRVLLRGDDDFAFTGAGAGKPDTRFVGACRQRDRFRRAAPADHAQVAEVGCVQRDVAIVLKRADVIGIPPPEQLERAALGDLVTDRRAGLAVPTPATTRNTSAASPATGGSEVASAARADPFATPRSRPSPARGLRPRTRAAGR